MLTLFYLLMGHFIADFPLQGEAMAVEKSRHSTTALQKFVPWYYWMTAHCAVHAAAVTLITGNMWIGLSEFFLHFAIDVAKCEGKTNIHQDQMLHILCKITWWLFLTVL